MSFFEFPHTRTYDSDLGWLIRRVIAMNEDLRNFININTIKYADPIAWNITTQYEANTVVINPADGTAYISTTPVPSGVSIRNTDYWTPIFNYGESMNILREQIAAANQEDVGTALAAYSQGQLVWWEGILYRVLYNIAAGTQLIAGINVEQVTIEDVLNELDSKIDDTAADIRNEMTQMRNELDAIDSKKVWCFDTVADMVSSDLPVVGEYCKTGGYHSVNDGGGAYYKIVASAPGTHYETMNSGSYALLICDDVYNVRKFGAYGDNSHNDNSAVLSAIATAGAFGGGVVLFPCGTYILTGININSSYITLRGESLRGTVLSFNSANDCITFGINYWYGRVENLRVKNTGAGYCISLKAPDNVVDKCEIEAFKNGVELGGPRNMLLNSNVLLTGTREDDVAVMVSSGDASSMIHNCLLKGTGNSGRGIFIKGGNAATTISHTSVLLMFAGLFLDLSSANIYSLKVDVCFIDNCKISVQLSGTYSLYRTIIQATWLGSCDHVFFTYETAKIDGLIFTNNEVSIVSGDALRLGGCDDVKILNNMFNRCSGALIAMNSSTSDTIISGNTFNGYADSDTTVGIAIYLDGQPTNCVIRENDFSHVNTLFGGSPSLDNFRGVLKDNIALRTENSGVVTVTGTTATITHDLSVVPDIILVSDGYSVSGVNWDTFTVTGSAGTCRWYAFKSYQM